MPKERNDLSGNRAGQWEILCQIPDTVSRKYYYSCRCLKCQEVHEVKAQTLSRIIRERDDKAGCRKCSQDELTVITEEAKALAGTITDLEVQQRTGVKKGTVRMYRRRMGIIACRGRGRPRRSTQ